MITGGPPLDSASAASTAEAAEGLLSYEAPPEIVEQAKAFLATVFENSEEGVADRLDALKLMRKFEAAKITPRTVHTSPRGSERDRREAWRNYEIDQRHWKLSLAIMDTPPKGWADDLYSDDYVAPDGWPPWG